MWVCREELGDPLVQWEVSLVFCTPMYSLKERICSNKHLLNKTLAKRVFSRICARTLVLRKSPGQKWFATNSEVGVGSWCQSSSQVHKSNPLQTIKQNKQQTIHACFMHPTSGLSYSKCLTVVDEAKQPARGRFGRGSPRDCPPAANCGAPFIPVRCLRGRDEYLAG